jgi:hypothetical protein
VFREYYKQWAFRHPSGKDFIAVFNDVVPKIHGDKFGPDLNWFFDQTLYGTGLVDYAVRSIRNTKVRDFKGIASEADSMKFVTDITKDDTVYISTVELNRLGEVCLPVEVMIHFESGDTITEHWNGKERYMDYEYTGPRQIDWVKLDPYYRLRMDVNFTNNSRTKEPDRVPIRRYFDKFIIFMQYFISSFSF